MGGTWSTKGGASFRSLCSRNRDGAASTALAMATKDRREMVVMNYAMQPYRFYVMLAHRTRIPSMAWTRSTSALQINGAQIK